jgi:hypothetical protein
MTDPGVWIELFDLSSCDAEDWRSWYDGSVMASRISVPGVAFARRGRGVSLPASDAPPPTWPLELGLYDLDDITAVRDPRWTNLTHSPDGRPAPLRSVGSSLYRRLSSTVDPYVPPTAAIVHGGFFVVPHPHQAEFDQWYEREHIAEQLRVPGYFNVRRFQCIDEPDRFVALYDVASLADTTSPEAAAALHSPWGDRVRQTLVASRARRLFHVERLERGTG